MTKIVKAICTKKLVMRDGTISAWPLKVYEFKLHEYQSGFYLTFHKGMEPKVTVGHWILIQHFERHFIVLE
jgi:hypothetical protein